MPKEHEMYTMKDGSIVVVVKVSDKEVSVYKATAWSGKAMSVNQFKSNVTGKIGDVELFR